MFAGDDFKMSAKASNTLGKPADSVRSDTALAEGKMDGRANASARPTRRGLRPWHVWTLLAREPGDLWIGHRPYWVAWSAAGSHYRPGNANLALRLDLVDR